MKNAMPKRETIGKISTFLRMKGFNSGGQSSARQTDRREHGLQNELPNSTKVGSRGSMHQVPIRNTRQLRRY